MLQLPLLLYTCSVMKAGVQEVEWQQAPVTNIKKNVEARGAKHQLHLVTKECTLLLLQDFLRSFDK